jgi:hypothetical protein
MMSSKIIPSSECLLIASPVVTLEDVIIGAVLRVNVADDFVWYISPTMQC